MPESSLDESYNLDEVTTRHISRVLEVAKVKINGPEGAASGRITTLDLVPEYTYRVFAQ
jgi:hypothetical protein